VTVGPSEGTAINAEGELTIAADETAETLTVTATSTLDNSKSGTASVTVGEKPEEAAYFGTWRKNDLEQLTIGSDGIELVDVNGTGFTMSGLTWTKKDNPGGDYAEDYPKGYSVTGTMTKYNTRSVHKADGSGGYCAVGEIAIIILYISTDKESIRRVNEWSWENELEIFSDPYNKTTSVEYWQVTWDLNGGEWAANDNHATQVAKDVKLAAPAPPTKTDNIFGGWYTESSRTNEVRFPYDVNSVTGNFTLYAKWNDATTAKFVVTTSTGSGSLTSFKAQRQTESGGFETVYDLNNLGTGWINVEPGTYRIVYTYWACQTVNCMSTGWSDTFSVSAGQTRTIRFIVGVITVE
jgi:uncharacterized repeat protein (TIGR02543 family)